MSNQWNQQDDDLDCQQVYVPPGSYFGNDFECNDEQTVSDTIIPKNALEQQTDADGGLYNNNTPQPQEIISRRQQDDMDFNQRDTTFQGAVDIDGFDYKQSNVESMNRLMMGFGQQQTVVHSNNNSIPFPNRYQTHQDPNTELQNNNAALIMGDSTTAATIQDNRSALLAAFNAAYPSNNQNSRSELLFASRHDDSYGCDTNNTIPPPEYTSTLVTRDSREGNVRRKNNSHLLLEGNDPKWSTRNMEEQIHSRKMQQPEATTRTSSLLFSKNPPVVRTTRRRTTSINLPIQHEAVVQQQKGRVRGLNNNEMFDDFHNQSKTSIVNDVAVFTDECEMSPPPSDIIISSSVGQNLLRDDLPTKSKETLEASRLDSQFLLENFQTDLFGLTTYTMNAPTPLQSESIVNMRRDNNNSNKQLQNPSFSVRRPDSRQAYLLDTNQSSQQQQHTSAGTFMQRRSSTSGGVEDLLPSQNLLQSIDRQTPVLRRFSMSEATTFVNQQAAAGVDNVGVAYQQQRVMNTFRQRMLRNSHIEKQQQQMMEWEQILRQRNEHRERHNQHQSSSSIHSANNIQMHHQVSHQRIPTFFPRLQGRELLVTQQQQQQHNKSRKRYLFHPVESGSDDLFTSTMPAASAPSQYEQQQQQHEQLDNHQHISYEEGIPYEKKKSESFPVKLMKAMQHVQELQSQPSNNQNHHEGDILSWLKDGKSFVMVDSEAFTQHVLPHVAKENTKYMSVKRQLGRYGFIRRNGAEGIDCYYHPYFLRDHPEMAQEIKQKGGDLSLSMYSESEEVNEYNKKPTLDGWDDILHRHLAKMRRVTEIATTATTTTTTTTTTNVRAKDTDIRENTFTTFQHHTNDEHQTISSTAKAMEVDGNVKRKSLGARKE